MIVAFLMIEPSIVKRKAASQESTAQQDFDDEDDAAAPVVKLSRLSKIHQKTEPVSCSSPIVASRQTIPNSPQGKVSVIDMVSVTDVDDDYVAVVFGDGWMPLNTPILKDPKLPVTGKSFLIFFYYLPNYLFFINFQRTTWPLPTRS